jgi:CheY-like chemotaxis protein
MANNIIHLEDGLEAINFLFGEGNYSNRDIENKPKVILLDLKMPKMNGIEVLAKLNESLSFIGRQRCINWTESAWPWHFPKYAG